LIPPYDESLDEDSGEEFPKYQIDAQPIKKSFKSWHKLRKQYVREEQWCKSIDWLLQNNKLDGRPLRYLGLPGHELLDIRMFHDAICLPKKIKFRYMGFWKPDVDDASLRLELEISMEEVRRMPQTEATSKVVHDDFRALSSCDSVAWKDALEIGPFDIVNVDLCDGFYVDAPGEVADTYYSALANLLTLQAGVGGPWVLFLTTRIGVGHTHQSTLSRLKAMIEKNLRECPDFQKACLEKIGVKNSAAVADALNRDKSRRDLMAVGLGKWLIHLGLEASPRWKVTVQNILEYKVFKSSESNDLISIAFRFEPIVHAPNDKHRFAAPKDNKIPTECELAAASVEVAVKRFDVDKRMALALPARETLADRAADLMRQARYDPVAYKTWALNEC